MGIRGNHFYGNILTLRSAVIGTQSAVIGTQSSAAHGPENPT